MSSDRATLPRGRHSLSREEVLASQRERLIEAIFDVVAERGYANTTVGDVVARARVSRNAFYELWADKEACFIAACDGAGEAMLAELYRYGDAPTWYDALRRGLHAYLAWWRERPWYATAYLVELPSAGRQAVDQRDRIYAQFAEMFALLAARARLEDPDLAPLPDLAPRFVVSAVTELIGQEVRAGRVDDLLELEDELLRFIVGLLAPR
jgi:AcrR family transcriptional regulator